MLCYDSLMSRYNAGDVIEYQWEGKNHHVEILAVKGENEKGQTVYVVANYREGVTQNWEEYEVDLYKYNPELPEQLEKSMKSMERLPRRRLDSTEKSE